MHEAATTNYDTLFEDAWSVVTKDRVAALPQQSPGRGGSLGARNAACVDDPGRELVLCRDDYLSLG